MKRSPLCSLVRGINLLGGLVCLSLTAALLTLTPARAFDNGTWTFPYTGTGSATPELVKLNNTGNGYALSARSNGGVAVYGSSGTGTGISGDATTAGAYGVVGYNYATSGVATGMYGVTYSTGGYGVYGRNMANGYGVYGEAGGVGHGVVGTSSLGNGVYGSSPNGAGVTGSSGNSIGVQGNGPNWIGVSGNSFNGTGVNGHGVTGVRADGDSFGVDATATAANSIGVRSQGLVTGVQATGVMYGVYASAAPQVVNTVGVYANGDTGVQAVGTGIGIQSTGGSYGVNATATGSSGTGVRGISTSGYGVFGVVTGANGNGVYGQAISGNGVYGLSQSGPGVYGTSTTGLAGYFVGNVTATGTITGAVKNFKIDDPRDPSRRYLVHASVESSELKNVYDGTVILDSDGHAVVQMPSYCETINGEFRYQLTAIGDAAPNLHIAKKMHDNQFEIAGGKPQMEVSWQVTGIRHDPYAEAHPMQVEQEKTGAERGRYLNPELYGKPDRLRERYVAPPPSLPASNAGVASARPRPLPQPRPPAAARKGR